MQNNIELMKVWDVPVRLFHWSLVLGFVLAYLSAEAHILEVHVLIGYALIFLLTFRVVWGFAGNQFARFKSFIFSPQETMNYLRSMGTGHPMHYYGHNPVGALMVFGMLALLMAIFTSGLVALAVIDFDGPLLFLANRMSDDSSYFFHHAHDFLVDVALLLIPLHLLGVISGSVQHKENLAKAMVTGVKQVVDPESAKR
jgi:cytochrome b